VERDTKSLRITRFQSDSSSFWQSSLHPVFFSADNSRYRKHYGNYPGNDASYPEYNVTGVLTSPAASAIASISVLALTAKRIMSLRGQAAVVCDNFTDFADCADRSCLFDIRKDPCETTDLSSQHLEVRHLGKIRASDRREDQKEVPPIGSAILEQ